jgi:hypothetical protein
MILLGTAGRVSAQDSWDAVYLVGSKVGHIHTFVEPVKDRGRDLLRVRIDMELSYQRLKDRITTKMQYGTIETLDGQVLRLDTRILASDKEIRVHGDAIGGKMNLMIDGTGQRQQESIPWGDDVRGPYAAEQSLSRSPMKPGETRSLKMFMPDLNRVCDVTLQSGSVEEVKLGGGVTRTLLKIAQTTKLDGKPRPEFDVTLWADDGGQVVKSLTENLGGLVVYRTTREAAIARTPGNPKFDQISNSVIKVTKKLSRPESTRHVRYRVALNVDRPEEIIPTDRRQSLTPGSSANEAIPRAPTTARQGRTLSTRRSFVPTR